MKALSLNNAFSDTYLAARIAETLQGCQDRERGLKEQLEAGESPFSVLEFI